MNLILVIYEIQWGKAFLIEEIRLFYFSPINLSYLIVAILN